MRIYLAEGGQLFKVVYTAYENLSSMGWANGRTPQKKRNMEVYLADVNKGILKKGLEVNGQNVFNGANILQSFYYCDEFTEKVIIPSCENFLLDSGAFTFFSNGKKVDWNDYIKQYADFVNRNKVENFFELDIDKIIGYENVIKLRAKLKELTGKDPIPVWHKSRGKQDFYDMCKQHKYVAIGGIVSKEISKNEYKYFPQLIKIAHDCGAKIHGLGFTNMKELEKCHFDSVDSTAWVSGNKFGAVYRFNGRKMDKYNKPQGMRLKNGYEVAYNNFMEWKKYCDYAKLNL